MSDTFRAPLRVIAEDHNEFLITLGALRERDHEERLHFVDKPLTERCLVLAVLPVSQSLSDDIQRQLRSVVERGCTVVVAATRIDEPLANINPVHLDLLALDIVTERLGGQRHRRRGITNDGTRIGRPVRRSYPSHRHGPRSKSRMSVLFHGSQRLLHAH